MSGQTWPAEVAWRESWDHRVHAFQALGDLHSTALCGHIAATTTLRPAGAKTRQCVGCELLRPGDRRGDGGNGNSL